MICADSNFTAPMEISKVLTTASWAKAHDHDIKMLDTEFVCFENMTRLVYFGHIGLFIEHSDDY